MIEQELLLEGLQQLQLDIPCEGLLEYLQLLKKWNKAYNLTAVREPHEMIRRHLFDSLAILPWVKGRRIIDVGTGPGLPGIPLALARPDLEIVLLDSNGKKTRFLQEVKRTLALTQIEIVQTRVETYHPLDGFDTVVSRAFSDLTDFVDNTEHLLRPSGIWLAMKGKYPESELAGVSNPFQVKSYQVPGVDGDRCCVIIEKE